MKDKTKKFALATIFAAIAGYLTGLLTAPKSGKETRKDIQEGAIKAKTEVEKQLKKLHSDLDDLLSQAKTLGKNVKTSAGEDLSKLVANAQVAKEKAREVLSALHEGDTDDEDLKSALAEVKKSVDHLKTYISNAKQEAKSKTSS